MRGVAVGVDCGGSSTAAAMSRDGELVRMTQAAGANANSMPAEIVTQRIVSAINELVANPDVIVIGAAGAGRAEAARELEASISKCFPQGRVCVVHDAKIALRASVPDGDGVVLIAGTGSIAYAERGALSFRCGGYGYLLGDEGSGFALGRAALNLLGRALDERISQDELTGALQERSNAQTIADFTGGEDPVAEIAGLAPLVLEMANDGVRSANKIVQAAALELGELVRCVVRKAGMQEQAFSLVLAGGLLEENSILTFLLETRLQNDFAGAQICKQRAPAWTGALALAERMLGP
ncbi:MAG: hypothetical protein DLM50_01580 [Candidatus Meridianibacter frigidus]|nr:MAG: hypothetical protein DLM50_01580 [Candidatus Eremiobacteraeota bacterium]